MADQEKCPRCHVGNLYVISEDDVSELHKCFACDYGESRVKTGYEVLAPGEPITKVGPKAKSAGGGV